MQQILALAQETWYVRSSKNMAKLVFFNLCLSCISPQDFFLFFQVPYKLKDVEQDYDNYNQVPESPIGRDEEPHLYMVPKKYRKVCSSGNLHYPLCGNVLVDLYE